MVVDEERELKCGHFLTGLVIESCELMVKRWKKALDAAVNPQTTKRRRNLEYKDPLAFCLHVEPLVTLCRQANRLNEDESFESSRSSRSLFDWPQSLASVSDGVGTIIQVRSKRDSNWRDSLPSS
jgi:hypothetical protein